MANSYGVIRRTIILGEAGTTWYVNLHKKDYTGTQESMTLFGEGFDLKWSGSGGTRDRRFIESECIVNFTVQNDTDESLLYDIFEKGDRNYFIRVYKNEETTNGLWWFGWVHPSFSTIENAPYPYKSKISATDSVGTFKKSADSELTTAQYNNTSNINTHIKSFGDEMGVYQGWATNLVDNGYFSLPQSNWVLDSPSTWSIPSGGGKADAASGVGGYMSQTGVSVTQNQTVSFTFTVQNYNSATNTLTLKNESGQDLATAIDITSDGTYVKTFDSLQNATEIRLHSSFGGSYSITNVTLVDGLVDTAPMPQITNWFYTSIDWWRNGDTYQSDDPFYLYRIGRTLFRDDAEDFPSKYSKYKVLDGALKIFNTVGVLSNGRYNFMQPNQYADNTSGDFRFYQYATGSSRDTSATTENHLLTLDGTVGANTGAVMSGSTLTYEPPFKSVSATYSGGQAIISIPNDVDFSTFTPVGDVQFDGNSTGSLAISFNLEHRERLLASDVDSLLLSGYNLTNHSFRTSTALIVKLSDGVSQYTLRKLINNSWVWEESSMTYTVFTPSVGYGHTLSNNYVYETSPCQIWLDSNGDYYNAVTKFSVPVLPIPPPPITGVISIKLTGGNNYFQWIDSGTSFGSFSTFNQNSVAITSTNHIINSYFISNNSGAFTSGTSGLKYSVINDDITSEESFDFGNILIGNNNSSTSSNNQNQEAVQYLDSSGNSVASYQGFSQGNSGVYTNITRLLCDQFLSLQKEPLEILQANIFSPDISPLKLLKYSINDDSTYKYYSFLGGSFKAQSETMSGEWFKVNDYTSSIDEDTEMEPEVESESSSNKVSVTKLNLIEQNVSLENAITDIDVEIDLNTSINKINCSGVSRGKVYNNQKLILRSPNNFEYLVVTVSQDTAIGASAININPITTTSIFPIGSTLSVLTYDLSNVITGGGGTPAGSDTQIQFNDSGSFGADANLTYNESTDTLTTDNLTVNSALKLSGDTIKDSGGNDIITSNGNGVITMAEGHISIGGSNANLELNNGSDILLGADALGGSSSTIMYYDAGGAGRQFIRVDSTNKVVICNRATNGTVDIKANTSSAGGGGETDVVTFKYNEAEFKVPITSEGLLVNPQSLTIKVFPSEFKNNADSGYPNYIHDSVSNKLSTRGKDNGDDFYAFIEIPAGHKVTHVKVYASSSVSSAVEVSSFNYKTGADNNVASTTFAFNENKSITNIVGSATQDLVIKCSPGSNSVYVYGAEVTLAIT